MTAHIFVAGLYVAMLIAAIVFARIHFHSTAPWSALFKGAVLLVIGSLIGGTIGGIVRPRPPGPITLLLPALFAAVTEELTRETTTYLARHRHLGYIVMLGIGFGGIEIIWRAGKLLLGAQPNPFSGVLAAEIFIFHICLTIIVYQQFVRGRTFALIAAVAVSYHVMMNFAAGYAAEHGLVYGMLIWTVMTPIHITLAWLAWRRPFRVAVAT